MLVTGRQTDGQTDSMITVYLGSSALSIIVTVCMNDWAEPVCLIFWCTSIDYFKC